MTRAQRVLTISAISATLYFLALFAILPLPFVSEETAEKVLPVLPWWLLVSFGAYAMWTLGWNVMTIRDCPEAYHELMNEISSAKNDLRARGVSVD
ncbi:hypothetical protein FS837_003206 [Tulasnella sp. UAMH 9824]|nr:hypothetical protein FS837_003206 [Tulasnella sp. UAMH 9824]